MKLDLVVITASRHSLRNTKMWPRQKLTHTLMFFVLIM